MQTYISLLRGINVTGQKKIKMDALRALYKSLRFEEVQTYIQTGNVVFLCEDDDKEAITKRIEEGIEKTFGFHTSLLLKKRDELKQVLERNPFREENVYITFLLEAATKIPYDAFEKIKQSSEQLVVDRDVIYLYAPDGYGRTKLSNNFFEAKLKMVATTRNLKTVKKLLDIAASKLYLGR